MLPLGLLQLGQQVPHGPPQALGISLCVGVHLQPEQGRESEATILVTWQEKVPRNAPFSATREKTSHRFHGASGRSRPSAGGRPGLSWHVGSRPLHLSHQLPVRLTGKPALHSGSSDASEPEGRALSREGGGEVSVPVLPLSPVGLRFSICEAVGRFLTAPCLMGHLKKKKQDNIQ